MAIAEPTCEPLGTAATEGYMEVLELARQQCEAIRQGQLKRFLRLLEERFVISERLRALPDDEPEIAEIRRQVLCLDNLMATLLRDAIARQSPACRAGTA